MDHPLSTNDVASEAFESAADFLRALCDAKRWTNLNAWYSPWVFRGQRDASWRLTPCAWRAASTPPLERLSASKTHFRETHREAVCTALASAGQDSAFSVEHVLDAYAQGRAEFRLVMEFVEMADRLGHPVPGMQRYASLRDYDWIPDVRNRSQFRFVIEPNPATTLAQHHGIPTRFLDWTRSAATAALFAASEVAEPEAGGHIAVWATRPDILVQHGNSAAAGDDALRFLVYEVPRAENAYLRAQDGLFLYPAAACMHFARHGNWPCFERFALATEQAAKESAIQKLTLPVSEVGELLRLLWLEGVSKAHLMPTYDNITAALLTKWRWHQ